MIPSAAIPDIIRLFALPIFGYAAWTDYKSRHVRNKVWVPVALIALLAFTLDFLYIYTGAPSYREPEWFFFATIISAGVLVPFGVAAWHSDWLSGADVKGLMLIALLYPSVPLYPVPTELQALGGPPALPFLFSSAGIFSFTILIDIVIIGALVPVALVVWNTLRGDFSPRMIFSWRVPADRIHEAHGEPVAEAFESTDDGVLNLEALQEYLDWRDVTLKELLENPDEYRECSLTDSEMMADGGLGVGDTWGAVQFVQQSSRGASELTPSRVREGLDELVDQSPDGVWVIPSVPYMLPIFFGLLTSIVVGNLLLVAIVVLT